LTILNIGSNKFLEKYASKVNVDPLNDIIFYLMKASHKNIIEMQNFRHRQSILKPTEDYKVEIFSLPYILS